jgi:diadenosine tetraphosphate (Ap4A) HIT family hydrolase
MTELPELPFLRPELWIEENTKAVALLDKYPVSRGHTLIVPKRVVTSIFRAFEGRTHRLLGTFDLAARPNR